MPATTSNTTTNTPWSGAAPYITSGLQSAQDLYSQGGPQYYPGQTYAGQTAGQTAGIAGLDAIQQQFAPTLAAAQGDISNASGIASNIGGTSAASNPSNSYFANLASGNSAAPGLGTLNDYASGKYLSADNPYFQQVANTTAANVLPTINAQFANSGRGNSGLAARAASEGLSDSIGGLAYNNYQQGLTQQQNAASALAGYGVTGAQGLASNFPNNATIQINAGSLGLNAASLSPSLQNMGINAANAALLGGTTTTGARPILDQRSDGAL